VFGPDEFRSGIMLDKILKGPFQTRVVEIRKHGKIQRETRRLGICEMDGIAREGE